MTLKGKVTDAETSEPLEGVLISLEWTYADTANTNAIDHVDTSSLATGSSSAFLMGTPLEIVRAFGGRDQYLTAGSARENQLYAEAG